MSMNYGLEFMNNFEFLTKNIWQIMLSFGYFRLCTLPRRSGRGSDHRIFFGILE